MDPSFTPRERALVDEIRSAEGAVVSQHALEKSLWGDVTRGHRRLTSLLRKVRVKLEVDPKRPERILTVHGDGYRWSLPPAQGELRSVLLGSREVSLTDGQVSGGARLTTKELSVLKRLAEAPGEVVSREVLARQIWRRSTAQRQVDQAVCSLRRKLETEQPPRFLRTVTGTGYQLVPEGARRVPQSGNLKSPPHPLFGRRASLREIERAFERERLVALKGPPGVGRQSLARAWAQSWRAAAVDREAWEIDMAGATTVEEADERLGNVLGLPLGVPPEGALLGRGELVLVITHSPLSAWPRIRAWLDRVPRLRVVAMAAAVDESVRVIRVPPLAAAASEALLRARSKMPLSARTARALARRLEGLPLALELAGAQLASHAPQDLLARLGEAPDLGLLDRDEPRLRTAVRRLWGALARGDQHSASVLSLLDASFGERTAQALLGPDARMLVDRLSAAALLQTAEVQGEPRLTLWGPVRAYAREQLTRRERRDGERALVAHLLDRCAEHARNRRLGERRTGTRLDLLLQGARLADRGSAPVLLLAAARALLLSGRTFEVLRAIDGLSSEELDAAGRASLALARGVTLAAQGKNDASGAEASVAVACAREARDRRLEGQGRLLLGTLALYRGATHESEQDLRTSCELLDGAERAVASRVLGMCLRHAGNPKDAEGVLVAAGQDSASFGDWLGAATARASLGVLYRMQGRLGLAEEAARSSLAGFHAAADLRNEAITHSNLGTVLVARGRFKAAETELRIAQRMLQMMGDSWGVGLCSLNLGGAARERGAYDEAATHLRAAMRKFPEGHAADRLMAEARLAQIDALRGRHEPALARARTIVVEASKLGTPQPRISAGIALGTALAVTGLAAEAAAAFRESALLAERHHLAWLAAEAWAGVEKNTRGTARKQAAARAAAARSRADRSA